MSLAQPKEGEQQAAGRKKQLGVDGRLGSLPRRDAVPGRACLAPPRTTLPHRVPSCKEALMVSVRGSGIALL